MGKKERLRSALVDARAMVIDVFGPEHLDPFISLEVAKVLMTGRSMFEDALADLVARAGATNG